MVIGVVVPAHDEAHLIGECLRSIAAAAAVPALRGEPVHVVVVLDSCKDDTALVARRHGASMVRVDARNVGVARDAGARAVIQAGARWLAFTDADTRVAPDWLTAQLALAQAGHDAVCGTVAIDDWQGLPKAARRRYRARYTDADGHRHVHGANLGLSVTAYRNAGGFAPLACHEDVALVEALLASGADVAWSARPRVVTSARLDSRAKGGFGTLLASMASQVACSTAATGAG